MSSQNYIKIPNYIYDQIIVDEIETGTLFHRIGASGFAVLSFLQIVQENKSSGRIRVTDIRDTLCMKKNETALKYLNALFREGLILINNKVYGDKIKSNELLNYMVSPSYLNVTQFEAISVELFNDKISSIGANGWSLLCYLTKLHNYSFGDINSNGNIAYVGYACPTLDQIRNTLNIGSKETILSLLDYLEKLKLITTLRSDVVTSYITSSGDTRFKRAANKYIVHNKVPGRSYYLSLNQQTYDKAVLDKQG